MRLDIPFPQYVANFSKSVFVSTSVRGRILASMEYYDVVVLGIW